MLLCAAHPQRSRLRLMLHPNRDQHRDSEPNEEQTEGETEGEDGDMEPFGPVDWSTGGAVFPFLTFLMWCVVGDDILAVCGNVKD